eukprot:gene7282-398_t
MLSEESLVLSTKSSLLVIGASNASRNGEEGEEKTLQGSQGCGSAPSSYRSGMEAQAWRPGPEGHGGKPLEAETPEAGASRKMPDTLSVILATVGTKESTGQKDAVKGVQDYGVDLKDTVPDPRDTVRDPRNTVPDPRNTARDPRDIVPDPRNTARDPRDIVQDPINTARDPRDIVQDPRNTFPDKFLPKSSSNRLSFKDNIQGLVEKLKSGPEDTPDKLVLVQEIGRGACGRVFKGHWKNMEVAIKTDDKAGISSMLEAAVSISLIHPNIVCVLHYDIVPVTSAANLLHDPTNNMRPRRALVFSMLAQVADGMAYIHTKKIIHGDLKPDNVLLQHDTSTPTGAVAKITDFGLSSVLDPGKSHVSNFSFGTPFYCSPEVHAEGKVTKASDVYSFGVMMWQLGVGKNPWIEVAGAFQSNPAFPHFMDTELPRIYVQLCKMCLLR